eukprot:2002471-Prymnesium_polylepis.1
MSKASAGRRSASGHVLWGAHSVPASTAPLSKAFPPSLGAPQLNAPPSRRSRQSRTGRRAAQTSRGSWW